MITRTLIKLLFWLCAVFSFQLAAAQAPDISYPVLHQVYIIKTPISPIAPVNTGGIVKAGDIGQVSTYAGAKPNDFGAQVAGLNTPYPMGITTDAVGNVYVADASIYKIKPEQKSSVYIKQSRLPSYVSTEAIAQGNLEQPSGIWIDAEANLYAIEIRTSGDYELQKFTPSGQVTTLLSGYTTVPPTLSRFAYLITDATGNVYLTLPGNNTIQKITPTGTASIFAGSPTAGATDGTGNAATFNEPGALTIDKAGNLYVCDNGNGIIRKITPQTAVSTLALKDENGPVLKLPLYNGLAMGPDGNLYVAKGDYPKILRIAADGMLATVAGDGTLNFVNGPGDKARFISPRYMTFDIFGNLFVSDAINHAVRKVNIAGYYIDKLLPAGLAFDANNGTISGTPTAEFPATDYTITAYNIEGSSSTKINIEVKGLALPQPLTPDISYPSPQVYTVKESIKPLLPDNKGGTVTGTSSSIVIASAFDQSTHIFTVDGLGNVYIADPTLNKITVYKTDGSTSTITLGQLHPMGIAIDHTNRYLYSIDYMDLSVWKADLMTGAVSKFSNDKSVDVSTDANGNVYLIQETGIVKLSPDGNNKTAISPDFKHYASARLYVNGAGTIVYWTTGITNEVFQLNTLTQAISNIAFSSSPYQAYAAMFIDDMGNLYGINSDSSVDKFDVVTGTKTNLVAPRYGTTKGTGPFSNEFLNLKGINLALDRNGNIYLLDADNNKPQVEKITNQKYTIDKPLPKGLTFDTETGMISGVPVVAFPATIFTVTAYNLNGSGSAKITIEVKNVAAPPKINYQTPQVYTKDAPIIPLAPVNTGGEVAGSSFTTDDTFKLPFFSTQTLDIDAAGYFYMAERFSGAIRKVKADGTVLASVTTNIANPVKLIVDNAGRYIYIINADKNLYKVDLNTQTTTKINSIIATDVSMDGAENLYISDGNNAIKKISASDGKITILKTGLDRPGALVVNADATTIFYQEGPSDSYGYIKKLIIATGDVTPVTSDVVSGKVRLMLDKAEDLYYLANSAFQGIVAKRILATNDEIELTPVSFNSHYAAMDDDGNIYYVYSYDLSSGIRKVTPVNYSIDKPLPNGLKFDIATGIISGTATVSSPATDYKVTAYNQYGSNSTTLSIAVKALTVQEKNPPHITYTTPNKYKEGTAITPLMPTNTGGAVPATVYGQVSTAVRSGNGIYFSTLTGVTTDVAGNLYIADYGSHLIYKVDGSGIVSVFAGNGNSDSMDGQGRAASFNYPDALITDAAGNIYVSDLNTSKIRKITPAGTVTTLAGSGNNSLTDGQGTAASFYDPRGLAIDAAGNIYVADQANNAIRKITPAGVVTTVATSFSTPTGVTIDAAGNLYVSDVGSSSVRKISPAGAITTIATGFNYPRELRIDGTGNIYVVEQNGNVIKRISPGGAVVTIAGTGATGNNNGSGDVATFNGPLGVALDGSGNLFVAETNGNTVRKVVISGYTIDKALPAGLVFDPTTGIISGTPATDWPATDYTITAYNGAGSHSTVVRIEVAPKFIKSVINFPPQPNGPVPDDLILITNVTSNNNETPVTYTSSNPDVVYVGSDGKLHIVDVGYTTITANQQGNNNYLPADPVKQLYTFYQQLSVYLPTIAIKTTCDLSFNANALTNNESIPVIYASTNPAVATISSTGQITIVGPGTTTITVNQPGDALHFSASEVQQVLTVTPLITPSLTITPTTYDKCQGENLLFTANPVNAGTNPTYQWSVNGINAGSNQATFNSSTLKTGDVVTCIVTNNDGCKPVASAVSNTATVTINPNISITASISSSATGEVLSGVPVTFTAATTPATGPQLYYNWQVNGISTGGNSPTFTSSTLADKDVVSCTITATGKCVITPSVNTNTIMVHINTQRIAEIVIPNTFTPNGDGVNDVWNIPGLLAYNDCNMTIYNRYGEAVHQSIGYRQPWDGTKNGNQVPTGVYYYIINFRNSSAVLSGSITVLR